MTIHLTSKTVENKVSQEDEISLVGGRLGARGSQHQPTTHQRGRGGRNLESEPDKLRDLYQVSITEKL